MKLPRRRTVMIWAAISAPFLLLCLVGLVPTFREHNANAMLERIVLGNMTLSDVEVILGKGTRLDHAAPYHVYEWDNYYPPIVVYFDKGIACKKRLEGRQQRNMILGFFHWLTSFLP